MKKIVLALSLVACVAVFTNCNRKCDCKIKTFGITTEITNVSLSDLNNEYGASATKCSDLNMSTNTSIDNDELDLDFALSTEISCQDAAL